MRIIRAAAAAAALSAGLWGAPASALATFAVRLDGGQEVPPVTADGTGQGVLALAEIGPGDFTLSYDIVFDSGIDFDADLAGMHIHKAPRGANGAIVFNILDDPDLSVSAAPGGGTRFAGLWDDDDGVWDLSLQAADFRAAAAGQDTVFYVNVHTTDFPAGEIRGQIVATPVPAALGLLGAGLAGLGLLARRRRG